MGQQIELRTSQPPGLVLCGCLVDGDGCSDMARHECQRATIFCRVSRKRQHAVRHECRSNFTVPEFLICQHAIHKCRPRQLGYPCQPYGQTRRRKLKPPAAFPRRPSHLLHPRRYPAIRRWRPQHRDCACVGDSPQSDYGSRLDRTGHSARATTVSGCHQQRQLGRYSAWANVELVFPSAADSQPDTG